MLAQITDRAGCVRRQMLERLSGTATHLGYFLRQHEAELRQQAAQPIDGRRAFLDESLTHTVQAQDRLLLQRLIGTKRMLGPLTASQIASASLPSFFPFLR